MEPDRPKKKKLDLTIFMDEHDLAKADCDYVLEPVPNKNCRTCNGKGYISVKYDTDSGAQLQPCGCVKWLKRPETKEEKLEAENPESIPKGQDG